VHQHAPLASWLSIWIARRLILRPHGACCCYNVHWDEWSLLGAIGIHLTLTLNPNPTPNPNPNPIGSYTVYMWNNTRNVFLWRPVNSTLPRTLFISKQDKVHHWSRAATCRTSWDKPVCTHDTLWRQHYITTSKEYLTKGHILLKYFEFFQLHLVKISCSDPHSAEL